MSEAQKSSTISINILWRVFFWLGLFIGIFGTGFATSNVNGQLDIPLNLTLTSGFFFIILGILITITGYLIGQEKNNKNKT